MMWIHQKAYQPAEILIVDSILSIEFEDDKVENNGWHNKFLMNG